ncbi:retrotransposon protein, putative, ty1-copia subclass [Tanacetum coccineum]
MKPNTIPPSPVAEFATNVLAKWNAVYDAHNEVACLMLGSMTPELHIQFENYSPYEMLQELKSMFEKQARVERFDLIQTFHACKQEDGKPVGAYVLKMKDYIEQLERLGYVLPQDLSVGLILNGLTSDFACFYEKGLPKKAATPQVMTIQGGRIQKANKKSQKFKGKGKGKGKEKDKSYIPKPKNPKPSAKKHPTKNDACHHCKEMGHWKRNCLAYLSELIKKKKQVGIAVSISKNKVLYFNAIPSNGIYEINMSNLVPNVNSIYNVSNKRFKHNLDSTYLWHCRLTYTSKKRIKKLQHDGILKSTDDESFDKCVSCLSGKMTRKSFPHRPERATDLLGLIHIDVCRPLRHVSRQGASYFITFMDDYSCYGYIYLLKHKHGVFETFKVFKNEVENQLGKTIKALRLDRGGEYISQEFIDYLKACGIVQQLTPPYTPQHNRVSERRNQSAARILNMVPTKKVDKTPYELWYGKVPNLSYLKETMSYYFYFSPENKIVVAGFAEFFEKNLWSQEVSGRAGELKEILDEDTSPSKITSEIPIEVEEVEEHSLGDLNEPDNYKAAMLYPESNKWLDAMNAEMKSMKYNQVWLLIDLPPNCKTVGSKWLFKKKTDMDGNVHTYKARLVAKGFKTLRGKYASFKDPFMVLSKHQEAGIKDLMRKSKGEATFILGIKIYRDRLKRLIGLCQSAYIDKILKRYRIDNSKRGYIPMQKRLDLNKTQGDSTPREVKSMQNVPYASVVGSIMYAVRCTIPDVAFAQNITSRFQQNPGEPHWTAVKTILKYLRNTKDMLLVYGGNFEAKLRVDCYCNAGFETDRDDTKSHT